MIHFVVHEEGDGHAGGEVGERVQCFDPLPQRASEVHTSDRTQVAARSAAVTAAAMTTTGKARQKRSVTA